MEHPKDPYHVRPFPQQPARSGKELIATLDELESALGEELPDLEKLRALQMRMHKACEHYNDDKLIDRLRQLSHALDAYAQTPEHKTLLTIMTHLLKARVDLKRL